MGDAMSPNIAGPRRRVHPVMRDAAPALSRSSHPERPLSAAIATVRSWPQAAVGTHRLSTLCGRSPSSEVDVRRARPTATEGAATQAERSLAVAAASRRAPGASSASNCPASSLSSRGDLVNGSAAFGSIHRSSASGGASTPSSAEQLLKLRLRKERRQFRGSPDRQALRANCRGAA